MTYNKTSAVSGDKLIEFLKHTVSNLSEVYLLNLAELAALKEKHAKEQLAELRNNEIQLIKQLQQEKKSLEIYRPQLELLKELQRKENALKDELKQAQQTIQAYNAATKKSSAHKEQFIEVWKDPKTRLMWTKAPLDYGKAYTWNDAVSACKQCSIAGYSNWRLPTIEELQTLMIKDEMGYACPKGALLELAQDRWGTYWSISRSEVSIKVANFNTGHINYIRNHSNVYLVRAVRNLK